MNSAVHGIKVYKNLGYILGDKDPLMNAFSSIIITFRENLCSRDKKTWKICRWIWSISSSLFDVSA